VFGGAETVVLSAKELVEPEKLLADLGSLAEDFLSLTKQDVVVDQQFPILMTNVKFEGTNQKSLEMIFL
jgi:hypothetical protein